MFDNVAVIIPVVRPDKARQAIEAVHLHCPGAEVVTDVDTNQIGCPAMVDWLYRKTSKPLIMFLGDDTVIQSGVLQNALKKMASLPDGWGVVGLNTEPGNDHAHWLADRRILEHIPGGQFFSTDYKHCYGDDELKDIAIEQGRWTYAADALVKHEHPVNGGASDEHYQRAYSDAAKLHDWQTYNRRKRARRHAGLAIGFPLVDATVPVQFFTSFACMDKPERYTLMVPQFPHGPFTGSIADARNSLVKQALDHGCDRLLMLDTDQIYPSDCLTRLTGHGVDICGVRVHRRWQPFDPIFLRGEIGKYQHVPDHEMYSGDLIEVDATGTGCLLFDMDVFLRVPRPWFQFSEHKGNPVGEDIYFCSQARKSGIQIFVDTAIEVGHLTSMIVNKHLHKICKHINQLNER